MVFVVDAGVEVLATYIPDFPDLSAGNLVDCVNLQE